MESLSQLVWKAHGSPEHGARRKQFRCYLCAGASTAGELTDKWMGGNFTGQTLARNQFGEYVCAACCFVTSRITEVKGRPAKEGKKFGGCFRNYSHCVDETGYFNASKGEKLLIREFLERDHSGIWGAAIADSGQKHVIPFAPSNGPGRSGDVLLDELLVTVPEQTWLIDAMAQLLTAGATKDEIGSGDYRSQTWMRCRENVESFEAIHGSERASNWFTLALWLAQRDEAQVEARLAAEKEEKANAKRQAKATGKPVRGDVPSNPKRVRGKPKGQSEAGLLGSNPGHDSSGDGNHDNAQRVGEQRSERSADPRTGQVRLFDFG